MTRNLKALELALIAISALGGVAAVGASAAVEHEFHADREKIIATGVNEEPHKAAVGATGTVECAELEIESTSIGQFISASTYRSDTITIMPHYGGCTFGGQPATVNMNHCGVVLDSDTTAGNPTGAEHANAEIECSGESVIEVETSVCTITISPQAVNHSIRFENKTESSVTVKSTAHKIVTGKKKTTESQTGCLLFPTGAILNYTGNVTVDCLEDEGTQPLEGTSKTTPTGSTEEGETAKCKVSNL